MLTDNNFAARSSTAKEQGLHIVPTVSPSARVLDTYELLMDDQ